MVYLIKFFSINSDPDNDSPVFDAIMDRIIHNSYLMNIEENMSMRECHGLNAMLKKVENE